ncbi:prenyltransferase [Oceanobacillus sp. CAU 1775]
MESSISKSLRSGWMVLRIIAVVSSSFVAILASLLPLFLHTSIPTMHLVLMFLFLSFGALTVHGGLTHLFNDYADFLSGTDEHSPAVLSGGSRVIQEGMLEPAHVYKLGKWVAAALLLFGFIMALLGRVEITILIVAGVWAAISYSLPPFSYSYRPFLGEWLSLFPAIFFLGIAGPWILLDTIPLWAYQHAIINALICMGWVMVHHIPDMEADKQATPKKNTTVVWITEKFGVKYAFVPAFLYLFLAVLCAVWVGVDRPFAAGIVAAVLLIGIFLVLKVNPEDVNQVTNVEKILLLIAIIVGVTLGIL